MLIEIATAVAILRLTGVSGAVPDRSERGSHCSAAQNDAAAADEPATAGRLPRWLKLGGEYRGRLEALRGGEGGNNGAYLNRLRVSASANVQPWLRLFAEGQDTRAAAVHQHEEYDEARRPLGLRQAWVVVGAVEGPGWSAQLGRQELAFGDERLVGADSFWDPVGRTFDAVRVKWQLAHLRVDAFSGTPPSSDPHGPELGRSIRLSGAYAVFDDLPGSARIEPYVFLKNDGGLAGLAVPQRRTTIGVRMNGRAVRHLDYNAELARQAGAMGDEPIGAWAAHGELGWRFHADSPVETRAGGEYNFSSGDDDPGDGLQRTFDDLFPAAFTRWGFADPFAWRNLHNGGVSVQQRLSRRWMLDTAIRGFWVVSRRAGLFAEEEYGLPAAGASGGFIGWQAVVTAVAELSPRTQLHAGYAHLFAGPYVRATEFEGPLSTPFVMLTYRF
jgi:hypothetical protein